MNLAKISANGQITVPMEIRRALNVKPEDKILFIQKPDGGRSHFTTPLSRPYTKRRKLLRVQRISLK